MGISNVTELMNQTDLLGIVQIINIENNQFLSIGILTALFFVLFITFKTRGYENKSCFTATMFICVVISTLLFIIDLAHPTLMFAMIIMLAGGIISLFFGEGGTSI